MLESSFLHIPGIGEKTEQAFWEQGLRTWNELEGVAHELLGPRRAARCLMAIEESRAALDSGDYCYFQERLGGAHSWRLLPACENGIAYLDIETTGTGFPPLSHSTTVAVSFRGELIVEHETRRKQELFERLQEEASMWVTFNGLSFDLPYLRRETGLPLRQPHVDLRVWMRRLGFTGGLKRIQKRFPDIPLRSSMDIDGFDAVRLWRMHEKGLSGALETLITYNAEDTVVLENLVYIAWELQRERMSHVNLPPRREPCPPAITTRVYSHVYDLLRGEATWELPSDW